jgi:hypothetical protein
MNYTLNTNIKHLCRHLRGFVMKVLQVWVDNEWRRNNTSRRKFREMLPKDYLNSTLRVVGASSLVLLSGAGLGAGGRGTEEGIAAFGYGTRANKGIPNGACHPGKNNNCEFINPLNATESILKFKAAGKDVNKNLFRSEMWLVTDDDENPENVTKGVLFYSNKEARKFTEQYKTIEDYADSDFYHSPYSIILVFSQSKKPVFMAELVEYIQIKNASIVPSSDQKELSIDDFLFQNFYDNETGRFKRSYDGSPSLEITFPISVSKSDFVKYFPQTLECFKELQQVYQEENRIREIDAIVSADLDYSDEGLSEIADRLVQERKAEIKAQVRLYQTLYSPEGEVENKALGEKEKIQPSHAHAKSMEQKAISKTKAMKQAILETREENNDQLQTKSLSPTAD